MLSAIKTCLPKGILDPIRQWKNTFMAMRTKRILQHASDIPAYLDFSALEVLQNKYPFPAEYGYDLKTLEERGQKRAETILRLPGAGKATRFLELGCWDGMVGYALRHKGKVVTAIDNREEGFDQRASQAGVQFLKMNASNLSFKNEAFDLVFSYDAFEHVAQPELVLQEAIRVVKTMGYIYLEFGPLYYSPYGEHAYRSITVPYCQFLFSPEMINRFADQKGLKLIDLDHVNGCSLEFYRNLWQKYNNSLKKVLYAEKFDFAHLHLIEKYPSCFKKKSNYFDNFIASSITVLFQKTKSIS